MSSKQSPTYDDRPGAILVTGCRGGLGRALCRYLLAAGHRVGGLDLPDAGRHQIPDGVTFHPLDLAADKDNVEAIAKIMRGYDGIAHLAGYSRVGQSRQDPIGALHANVMGTANILEAIRLSAPNMWMLLASSLEVKTGPDGGYNFTNLYGITKSVAELIAQRYVSDYGLRVAAARIAGIYGDVGDYPDKVPLVFVRNAVRNEPIHVRESQDQLDYVHVDMVCDVLSKAMDKLSKTVERTFAIFEVRSGKTISLTDLADLVVQVSGSDSETRPFTTNPEFDAVAVEWNFKYAGPNLKSGLENLVKAEVLSMRSPRTGNAT